MWQEQLTIALVSNDKPAVSLGSVLGNFLASEFLEFCFSHGGSSKIKRKYSKFRQSVDLFVAVTLQIRSVSSEHDGLTDGVFAILKLQPEVAADEVHKSKFAIKD